MGFFDGVPCGDGWFHDAVSYISRSMNTTVRSANLINRAFCLETAVDVTCVTTVMLDPVARRSRR
jgi:hypothetical protein